MYLHEVGKTTVEVWTDAARMVSWQFSLDTVCYPPGDFFQQLLDTMVRADRINRVRLEQAYPIHMQMIDLARSEDPRGKAIVEAIARIGLSQKADPEQMPVGPATDLSGGAGAMG